MTHVVYEISISQQAFVTLGGGVWLNGIKPKPVDGCSCQECKGQVGSSAATA